MLHPFNPDFYAKLGFVPISYCQDLLIKYKQNLTNPSATMPKKIAEKIAKIGAKKASKNDIPFMLNLYNTTANSCHSYKLRTKTDYKAMLTEFKGDGGEAIILTKNSSPFAYCFYNEKRVFECVGATPEDLSKIKQLNGLVYRELLLNPPHHSPLTTPRSPKPFSMAKITNCELCFTNDFDLDNISIYMFETY
jgi:hypothetical protein